MIIQTRSLHFAFGRRVILSGIDLAVPEGSVFGFLGPNGAGKTTTIKCLLGLLPVHAGMIEIFGKELNSNTIDILSRTGSMVEEPSLYGHLSATDNLRIVREMRGRKTDKPGPVLEMVGLGKDAHRPVRQFSSGMKQRLCLAMALLARPRLLLLDEPINGLDPAGIIEIRHLLQKLSREDGVSLFVSSHILGEIEKLCSHAAVIDKGKILYQGDMQTLLQQAAGKLQVQLQTSDNQQANALLLSSYQTRIQEHALLLPVTSREEIGAVVRALVEHGIDVYQVSTTTRDLETSFLALTGHAATTSINPEVR